MGEVAHAVESPFLEMLGTEVEEWREGFVRISMRIRPEHLNRSGVVHGGVIATLLDHGGGFCGLYCGVPGHRRYGMTLSLTCNFIAQTKSGMLTVTGRRTSGGRRIYFTQTEIHDDGGTLVATGTSVHRYRAGSETPEGVPVPEQDR